MKSALCFALHVNSDVFPCVLCEIFQQAAVNWDVWFCLNWFHQSVVKKSFCHIRCFCVLRPRPLTAHWFQQFLTCPCPFPPKALLIESRHHFRSLYTRFWSVLFFGLYTALLFFLFIYFYFHSKLVLHS